MKNIGLIILILLSIKSFGQIMTFEHSTCDPHNTDPYELKERIIKKDLEFDSLILILGKREICCATFNADFKLRNDTLRLYYKNIGDACFCTCFYNMIFKFSKIKNMPKTILLNDYEFQMSDKIKPEYTIKIDTLENGNIVFSKYEDENLIFQTEDQDSIKIYREYYKHKLTREFKRNKK